jgi:DNA-binding transcriptional LysR family regulator
MLSPQEVSYFLECSRQGNLTRAAERLGITQPALTMALRRLEDEVGAELFHRSKKGIRLTKAGQKFQQEAKNLEDYWKKLTLSLRESETTLSGTYSIGCHPSVALYSLPQTLPKVLADFPQLHLDLQHDLSRKITERVINGELDIAIVVNPVRHPDLVIRPLCKDKVGFWRSREETATNLPGHETSVLLCQPDLLQTQSLLRKLKLNFSRQVQSASLEVIASLAEAGAGVAILPGRVARRWKKLQRLDLPEFQDEIALLYRVENRKNSAFRVLAERLEKGMLE